MYISSNNYRLSICWLSTSLHKNSTPWKPLQRQESYVNQRKRVFSAAGDRVGVEG